ncbi:NusG domain II-containing protein [Konateibacter massiliensis]|uniref:NusG domain II-containing protein n=1 Tax=Konateibacter massiliensis TaxID=2002841 RepID=UPI000C152FD3|nr:NusG domain II-containing protein [Konateibacter massiliensis]
MKKNDIILIGIVVVLAIIGFAFFQLTAKEGAEVVVTVEGQEYGVYPLNKEAEIEIKSNGGINVLVIKDNKAKMMEADCPDELCVNQQPAISKTGETITCLPHKVVVTVKNGEESEVDAIAK